MTKRKLVDRDDVVDAYVLVLTRITHRFRQIVPACHEDIAEIVDELRQDQVKAPEKNREVYALAIRCAQDILEEFSSSRPTDKIH